MRCKNLIGLLLLLLIISLLAPGSRAMATVWTDHYDVSNGYSFAGEGTSTITFDDWGYIGPQGRNAKNFGWINGFGALGQRQHVATLWPNRLTPDDPQNIKHDITNFPVYTNANMDSQVNFYYWGYTSPGFDLQSDYSAYAAGDYSASTRQGSLFNNMQVDLDGDYFVNKADMHFGYYDTFSYRDTTGVNPPQEVKTSLSFQPYPVSDAKGWCGSVMSSHPNALDIMAGQLTFDFAFDVYGSTGEFMGTQIAAGFQMRSYGTFKVNVWAGSDLQTFSSDAVINNTNPNNKDHFDLDPDFYRRVSFHGAGVLPDGVWVTADSYNPDGSRKLNPNGTWNVTVVLAGTPGAVWHDNAFAGYAFILRADGIRMLDWWDVATYGPDLCVGKNCDDGNLCTTDSCVGGVCVHKEACDDHNFCTVDTCNAATGGCTNTPIPGCGLCSGQLDGTPCIDGDRCTFKDICRGGVCTGTPVVGCGSAVATTGNNFTMDDPSGTAAGGTNDVKFTWDGKVHSDLIGVSNATLTTNEPFQSYLWYAKGIEVVGPGTHRVDIFANSSDANNYFYEVTVPADKIGAHMLFDWGQTTSLKSCCKTNCDIDVWIVWDSNKSFTGKFWAGPDNGVTSSGASADQPTTCVPVVPVSVIDGTANTSATVWDLVSIDTVGRVIDSDGNLVQDYPLDGIAGLPMGDGPFAGFNANFSVMTGIKADKCEAGWETRCNDSNPCTIDTCEKATGNCVNTPKDCNDGNVCTNDACDSSTGNCVYTNNASSCDDGNPCTSGDVCSGVVCAGTPIANCTGPGVDTYLNNFTMMDPGGALSGGANDVHFTWDATRKTSVAASGQVPNATLSSPCPFDGITWTAHDVAIYGPGTYTVYADCPAGSPGCGSGVPVVFTVGAGELGAHMLFDWGTTKDIDVVDIWTPKAAFAPSPLMIGGCGSNPAYKVWDWMSKDWNNDHINGAPMVDGPFLGFSANFNVMGVPAVVSCTPPVNGCEDNNVCTNNDWDATAHGPGECPCINSAVAPGTACNDGQFCNGSDTCVNKSCTHAGDPCVGTARPYCNPTAGRCDQCRTDADCTTDKMCQNNVCVPRNVVCTASNVGATCNDNNACTSNDKCVKTTVNKKTTYVCQGTTVANGTVCDSDNNACTTDTCSSGVCKHTAKNCNDNNACTTDGCDPVSGQCTHTAVVCNDNNECTTDTCVPATGCKYTAKTNGTACTDDGNACTTDTCQSGVCKHTAKTNGTACSDGNLCTEGDSCQSGVCKGKAKDCNDHNKCTTDSCNPATGACVHTFDKPTSVTVLGSNLTGESSATNAQIKTTFTVTNPGHCIVASGDEYVFVSLGSVVSVDCKTNSNPKPTTLKLNGKVQPNPSGPGSFTCPDATTAFLLYLDNLAATGGKDRDNILLMGIVND